MAANKVQADQIGAQTKGAAVKGNKNTVNTGQTNKTVSFDGGTVGGNLSVNNGLSASDVATLFSGVTQPTATQVSAATPPAVIPGATPSPGLSDSQKKIAGYVLLGVAALGLIFVLKFLFKK